MTLISLAMLPMFTAACEQPLLNAPPSWQASRSDGQSPEASAIAAPLTVGSIPHKEKAAGTIHFSAPTSAEILHQEWTAAGNGTHVGRYTQSGSHDANLATGAILNGVFTTVAADGSTISGTYAGSFTLDPDGTVNYLVTPVWLAGTGRLAGVTGSGTVHAVATGATAGSTFTYRTDARFQRPGK